MIDYELLSWGGNFLSVLLFVYLFIKTIFISPACFDAFDTVVSLGNVGANVFVQFFAVTNKYVKE